MRRCLMKEEIFAIPLWDAFRKDTECPLCAIQMDVEKRYIESVLDGETVMDGEFNNKLKNYTFCEKHFRKLFEYPDKLGLALIVEKLLTYEMKYLEQIKRESKPDCSFGFQIIRKARDKMFRKRNSNERNLSTDKQCYLCKHIEETMSVYIETLINLWEKNKEFRTLYESSKGYCHRHFHSVINLSNKLVDKLAKEKFLDLSFKIQQENMRRLNEELKWFIKKFDYRFASEPWKTSKDSLSRSIIKITGNFTDRV